MGSPFDLWFWVTALAWLIYALPRFVAVRRVARLPGRDALPAADGMRVSVIVTARDEERRIEDTVRRLLAQRDIDVEIVVVDDRSTDATPRILERLATEHAGIRHVRVDNLPEGWLGKTHACHVGAGHATGDWLLFTDADAWMVPDLVARAVGAAVRDGIEHVALFPREQRPDFFSRAADVFFAVMVAPMSVRINRGARGAFAGVGAFNLVRADAYRATGGHDTMRLAIVDDLELGLALYRAGYATRLYEAFDDLAIEWAPTLGGVVRAFEKNFFAMFGYSVPLALTAIVGMSLWWAGAVIGPFTGSTAGIAAGVAMLLAGIPGLEVARRAGFSPVAALISPLMLPVLIAAMVNSAGKTLARGGVRWRDTFYPLAVLTPSGVWRSLPPGIREVLFAPKPPRASL